MKRPLHVRPCTNEMGIKVLVGICVRGNVILGTENCANVVWFNLLKYKRYWTFFIERNPKALIIFTWNIQTGLSKWCYKLTLPKGDKPLCSGIAFGLSAAEQSALKSWKIFFDIKNWVDFLSVFIRVIKILKLVY